MRFSRLRDLKFPGLLGATLFAWGVVANSLSAATFIVGAGGAPCTHATLAAAVAAAQANGPGDDTIRLAVPSLTLAATLDINDHGVHVPSDALLPRNRRIDSPLSSIRCAPLTNRSRIASAIVGFPPLK